MKNISFRDDVLPLKDELFRLALHITLSREDAEDIVQDTLMKVWKRRDSWESIESIKAYSLTICRNLSLDHLKLHENQNLHLDNLAEQTEHSSNPYDQILIKDRVRIVKMLIESLPEKQRTCIQLRDIEGKAYKEIAEIMQVSEEQVKVNIFRARQAIKQKMKKVEDK